MLEQPLECLVENAEATRPLHAVRPSGLAAFLDSLSVAQSRFLRQLDFTAAAQELRFLPGDEGVAGAVLGLGEDTSPAAFGNLVASITIQQIGTTGTATPEQVRQRWREVNNR